MPRKKFNEDKGYVELHTKIRRNSYALNILNLDIPWDLTSFRPSIENYIGKGKIYDSVILMEKQNTSNGNVIFIPRKIQIDNIKDIFVNVR